jgi:two-component system phosphate regulon sensor histidine kinase PhoR
MRFRAKTNRDVHRRHRASPFWRLVVPVCLLLLVPIFTYTALELASLNERENLIQNLYQAQLSAILFSVNQYCWDVVNGWGNFLRTELQANDGPPASSSKIITRLANVQQRYAVLSGASAMRDNKLYLALPDSMAARQDQVTQSIARALAAGTTQIERMQEQARKGYSRPAVLKLKHDSTDSQLLFVFSFEPENENEPARLGGLLVSSENFVRQVLSHKIAEFESKNFLLAVKRAGTNRIIFATQDLANVSFEQEEPLWVLPDMKLAIRLAGLSTAEIARSRTKRTLLLMLGIDAVILAAVILLLRIILRETELARLKSDFVDNVSHDLRTPLGLIRMFAETLEMGRLASEEKRQEYYRTLSREAARLTRMVNNLLDFSRIEAGRKVYEPKSVELPTLIKDALDSYRFHLQQRGFVLVEQLDDGVPPISADVEAVAQAFLNLLDNAVKYSAEEKHIAIGLRREGEWAVIEVKDRGIGIEAKHLDKIFGKFYRVETVGHETRGAGVGLALVQHIMQAHHGSVEVSSTPGKGSSFLLKFPLAAK